MVLISLAILFAALGVLSLTGSDSDVADPPSDTSTSEEVAEAPSAPVNAAPPAGGDAVEPADPATTEAEAPVEVRVLNNSEVSGLAAGSAATLTSEGWTVAETGNFSATQFPSSAVYYDPAVTGEQQAAQTIAGQLGLTAEPRPDTLSTAGTGVIVIVTQ